MSSTRFIIWKDENHCRNSAQLLALSPALRNAIIELRGGLGAGKTTFVRYLLKALGVKGRIKSPTYTVVEPYLITEAGNGLSLAVHHFDLYRFNNPHEWEDAGFRELVAAQGLKIIEWPEKARAVLPLADLVLKITPDEHEQRQVVWTAQTAMGLTLLP
jgi:tRNA threonylcarbamoyladenosine biosynthesis protein TsaE